MPNFFPGTGAYGTTGSMLADATAGTVVTRITTASATTTIARDGPVDAQ